MSIFTDTPPLRKCDCSGAPALQYDHDEKRERDKYWVKCSKCGLRTEQYEAEYTARLAWNNKFALRSKNV